ncbi:transketolase [Spiroplasma endosymbiont of Polydrusus pterygomalis]|uniref:transketolase n=1 Tax=Spiroplasma endosymbiont of Polydrusus pterygomalis TaxID=3139327 RepID=UPI003CCB3E3D
MKNKINLDKLTINSIRMLGVQAVNTAKSGHPGIVLGAAPMAFALFKNHLAFNPENPKWFNRDRFILSAGHGSALLYSILHHAGYQYTINDLKQFRQWGSNTPGHPEYHLDYGVETATGPLGQGLANGVGMALSESFLSAKYNQKDLNIIDHYTYVICGDGDLQEGIAQEALSFAGHFKLKKLIVLHDSNDIQLDSVVQLVSSENLKMRMESLQWNYLKVVAGEDDKAIAAAIAKAKTSDKPTFIEIKTIIGYGASKQGTPSVHGAPLMDDIKTVAKNLKWEYPEFTVPVAVTNYFTAAVLKQGSQLEANWKQKVEKYAKLYPKLYAEIKSALNNEIFNADYQLNKIDWTTIIGTNPQATRIDSGNILKILSSHCPTLIGGSADLSGSTKAAVADKDFLPLDHTGRHIHYGVREFAMGALVNGITLHQGTIAFGSTFLVFSDYLKPALRLAALMAIPSLFIFSHDSIAVGEDGPTHEPIEQLAMLRTIPNFNVIRPADTKETIGAYLLALNSKTHPNAIIITRQNLPQLANSNIEQLQKGAYIISEENKSKALDLIIIATGSEVSLAIASQEQLWSDKKINGRVISMPSPFIFDKQDKIYQSKILPNNVTKVVIEMGFPDTWYKYIAGNGFIIGVNTFGASAPDKVVLEKYGFTSNQVCDKINKFLNSK